MSKDMERIRNEIKGLGELISDTMEARRYDSRPFISERKRRALGHLQVVLTRCYNTLLLGDG